MRPKKKRHSTNPYWHGLFAKKRVQIGQFLPQWPHLYFPSAYRGSPPCTLSRHPNIRERHGTAMHYTNTGCQVLNLHRAQFLSYFGDQPSGALCRARERGELIRYSGAIQLWWVSDAPSWGNFNMKHLAARFQP